MTISKVAATCLPSVIIRKLEHLGIHSEDWRYYENIQPASPKENRCLACLSLLRSAVYVVPYVIHGQLQFRTASRKMLWWFCESVHKQPIQQPLFKAWPLQKNPSGAGVRLSNPPIWEISASTVLTSTMKSSVFNHLVFQIQSVW